MEANGMGKRKWKIRENIERYYVARRRGGVVGRREDMGERGRIWEREEGYGREGRI